jgi:hypothetical protein
VSAWRGRLRKNEQAACMTSKQAASRRIICAGRY